MVVVLVVAGLLAACGGQDEQQLEPGDGGCLPVLVGVTSCEQQADGGTVCTGPVEMRCGQ